jgi:CheY-like chemotaxis protein/HPt (histidine-containing phosphotransfer) domain-containing protein
MEGCGGRVGIDSTLGEGSTFWFELPVAVVAASATGVKEGVQDPSQLVDLTQIRVLIAEDNPINQKLLLAYANRMGLNVELAENGRLALEAFAPDKFDLVLMDVAMPEMDGIEATRRIREKWAGIELPPILLLTAHVMDAIEEDAKLVGIQTVLSKPIPFEELKAAIIAALASSKAEPAPVVMPADTSTETAPTAEPLPPELPPAKSIIDMMSPAAATELSDIFGLAEVASFVQKYITDATERLDKIEAGISSGDDLVVTQQAHSLKGASHVFGFADIPEWALNIEKSEPGKDPQMVLDTAAKIRARLKILTALL